MEVFTFILAIVAVGLGAGALRLAVFTLTNNQE